MVKVKHGPNMGIKTFGRLWTTMYKLDIFNHDETMSGLAWSTMFKQLYFSKDLFLNPGIVSTMVVNGVHLIPNSS